MAFRKRITPIDPSFDYAGLTAFAVRPAWSRRMVASAGPTPVLSAKNRIHAPASTKGSEAETKPV